jgi:hypothetical protein
MTATIITRAGKGSLLTVPEMDQNFKNLNEQILRTDSRNPLMPAFRSDFANSGMVDPRINFSRNSTATYFDKYGVMRTAKAGEPRIDYDPVTGECKGLLIEESRTNLLTYSEQFGNWSKQSIISLQEDQMLSPKATMSADLLNGGYIYQRLSGVNPSNNIYTFSVWIYSTAIGTIKTGIASWGGVEYQQQNSISANTWTRVIQTATFGSSSGDLHPKIYTDSPISFYIWGAQLEAGSTATSYIPTTSSSVTRAADNLSISKTNQQWFNSVSGTLSLNHDALTGTPVLGDSTTTIVNSRGPGVINVDYSDSNLSVVSQSGTTSTTEGVFNFDSDLTIMGNTVSKANAHVKYLKFYPKNAIGSIPDGTGFLIDSTYALLQEDGTPIISE